MNIATMQKRLLKRMPGQDIAEMDIEARREADQNNYQVRANPFEKGSFEHLCYTDACQQHWSKKNGL